MDTGSTSLPNAAYPAQLHSEHYHDNSDSEYTGYTESVSALTSSEDPEPTSGSYSDGSDYEEYDPQCDVQGCHHCYETYEECICADIKLRGPWLKHMRNVKRDKGKGYTNPSGITRDGIIRVIKRSAHKLRKIVGRGLTISANLVCKNEYADCNGFRSGFGLFEEPISYALASFSILMGIFINKSPGHTFAGNKDVTYFNSLLRSLKPLYFQRDCDISDEINSAIQDVLGVIDQYSSPDATQRTVRREPFNKRGVLLSAKISTFTSIIDRYEESVCKILRRMSKLPIDEFGELNRELVRPEDESTLKQYDISARKLQRRLAKEIFKIHTL